MKIITVAEIERILKRHLRASLVVTTHHGDRDEIHGAEVSHTSIRIAAKALDNVLNKGDEV